MGGGSVPKLSPPPLSLLISTFGFRLEPGCKSNGQIILYRAAKRVQKRAIFLSIFSRDLIIDPEAISCSLACRPDYRKYFSPGICYIFTINDLSHRPSSEKWEKSRKNSKQRPSKGTYSGWILRTFSKSVFYNVQITSEPLCSDPCARLKIQICTHALSQLGVSQNSLLLWSNLTAGKHIWHPPWAWM